MKYNILEEENKIIIKDIKDFEPKDIFQCGQAFRWYIEDDNSYTTIAYGKVINVKKDNEDIILSNTNIDDFNNIWYDYFDLARDYAKVKKQLSKDPILAEAIKFGQGIRILNQEPFEMIISFIISANNQIPRIKKSIELISKTYGEKIETPQGSFSSDHYSFPSAERLSRVSPEELREITRVGFRDVRIVQTSQMIKDGEISIDEIFNMNREEGKKLLMTLPGVGPKVSDCILLFAFNKDDAFPVDLWVKRVMEHFYLKKETNVKLIGDYGAKIFGDLAGFAQQYLFYYAREQSIGKH